MPQWERERLFDQRTVKRHIRSGMTSRSDYEAYLAELPDAAANVRDPDDGGDDDGYDGEEPEDDGDEVAAEPTRAAAPAPAAADDGWGDLGVGGAPTPAPAPSAPAGGTGGDSDPNA